MVTFSVFLPRRASRTPRRSSTSCSSSSRPPCFPSAWLPSSFITAGSSARTDPRWVSVCFQRQPTSGPDRAATQSRRFWTRAGEEGHFFILFILLLFYLFVFFHDKNITQKSVRKPEANVTICQLPSSKSRIIRKYMLSMLISDSIINQTSALNK